MKKTYSSIVFFLQNPFVVISSVVLGLFIGFYSPSMGALLEPYGNAFMALLEMSLLPIVISAIALSVSNLLCIKNDHVHTSKMTLVLFSTAMMVSLISCCVAYVLDPAAGLLGSENLKIKEITTSAAFLERKLNVSIVETVEGGLSHFLATSVPKNIFHALAQGNMLQIIIFSIIFGVAISYLIKSERLKVQAFCNTTLTIFQKIIMSITVWLPIAIICLMAGGASAIGVEIMMQMGGFILKVYAIFMVILIACTWGIKQRMRCSFVDVLRALKDPIIIAFGTRSSILPIPSILDAFENKIPVNQSIAKLLVPLGAVLGRFGNIAYFAFLAIFIAGVYQTEMSFGYFVVIIVLSTLAGLSTAGATGILTLSALTIVLNPLQLPLGAILPLLIAVDAIIDPMRTLVSVYTNCAAVVFISPKEKSASKKKLKASLAP